MNPFVSIVIPTRDRPELLVAVLEFIKRQSFKDFEVIISDNSLVSPCYEAIKSYLDDSRFKYKRPEKPLGMCEHWEFAIEGVSGCYVSIFSEKFILRRDALDMLFLESAHCMPDVVTWPFEYFDAKSINEEGFKGNFHPRVKPQSPEKYTGASELERRFSFDFPSFCRKQKHLDNRGKIYGGFVKRSLLERIKSVYGRIFYPGSPDFTSMIAILNEGETFIDISQPLMLFLNVENTSNGVAASKSMRVAHEFLLGEFDDLESYKASLPIKNVWAGLENNIARDYVYIKDLAKSGPVKGLNIDKVCLSFWVLRNLQFIDSINGWDGFEREEQYNIINNFIVELTPEDKVKFEKMQDNISLADEPSERYIYHSGVIKSNKEMFNLSARSLSKLNWHYGIATQTMNIAKEFISLDAAEQYLYDYSCHSRKYLGI